jgi:hypothetical protein
MDISNEGASFYHEGTSFYYDSGNSSASSAVQCAFASANVPLLSKSQTLRKTLEGGSSVVKIRRQVLHILCSNPRT